MVVQKKTQGGDPVRRGLAALKRRVTWLEAALTPRRHKPAVDRESAGAKRDDAEAEAKHKALLEYYGKRHEDFLRGNPSWLDNDVRSEQDMNSFLASRGLKAEPSRIPASFNPRFER